SDDAGLASGGGYMSIRPTPPCRLRPDVYPEGAPPRERRRKAGRRFPLLIEEGWPEGPGWSCDLRRYTTADPDSRGREQGKRRCDTRPDSTVVRYLFDAPLLEPRAAACTFVLSVTNIHNARQAPQNAANAAKPNA